MNGVQFNHWLQAYSRPVVSSLYQRQPLLMGVLNVTPDSFTDGGRYLNGEHAYQQAMKMIAEGADIIDIGGESSRPGASLVGVDEELARVIPVIERLRAHSDICISIDTYKPQVMIEAVKAGANLINDIKALQAEGALAVAAKLNVPVCLMHMQGTPKTMQDKPTYVQGVVTAINDFFEKRLQACSEVGMTSGACILDPGFGFGKTDRHNLQLIKHLNAFHYHGCPLLIGVSRKSTIGRLLNQPITERLIGGIAFALYVAMQGGAIIRTHDIKETRQALQVLDCIYTH